MIIFRFLDETEGFVMEPRSGEFLPENFVNKEMTRPFSWFLNAYKCTEMASDEDYMKHIKYGLENLNDL